MNIYVILAYPSSDDCHLLITKKQFPATRTYGFHPIFTPSPIFTYRYFMGWSFEIFTYAVTLSQMNFQPESKKNQQIQLIRQEKTIWFCIKSDLLIFLSSADLIQNNDLNFITISPAIVIKFKGIVIRFDLRNNRFSDDVPNPYFRVYWTFRIPSLNVIDLFS